MNSSTLSNHLRKGPNIKKKVEKQHALKVTVRKCLKGITFPYPAERTFEKESNRRTRPSTSMD